MNLLVNISQHNLSNRNVLNSERSNEETAPLVSSEDEEGDGGDDAIR